MYLTVLAHLVLTLSCDEGCVTPDLWSSLLSSFCHTQKPCWPLAGCPDLWCILHSASHLLQSPKALALPSALSLQNLQPPLLHGLQVLPTWIHMCRSLSTWEKRLFPCPRVLFPFFPSKAFWEYYLHLKSLLQFPLTPYPSAICYPPAPTPPHNDFFVVWINGHLLNLLILYQWPLPSSLNPCTNWSLMFKVICLYQERRIITLLSQPSSVGLCAFIYAVLLAWTPSRHHCAPISPVLWIPVYSLRSNWY